MSQLGFKKILMQFAMCHRLVVGFEEIKNSIPFQVKTRSQQLFSIFRKKKIGIKIQMQKLADTKISGFQIAFTECHLLETIQTFSLKN